MGRSKSKGIHSATSHQEAAMRKAREDMQNRAKQALEGEWSCPSCTHVNHKTLVCLCGVRLDGDSVQRPEDHPLRIQEQESGFEVVGPKGKIKAQAHAQPQAQPQRTAPGAAAASFFDARSVSSHSAPSESSSSTNATAAVHIPLSYEDMERHMTEHRTRVCQDWRGGRCPHDKCFDMHSEDGLRRAPIILPSGEWNYLPLQCVLIKTGKCGYGDACYYAHRAEELYFHPLNYKTTLCGKFKKHGQCSFGAHCPFAHTPDELRTVSSDQRDAERKLPLSKEYKTQPCDQRCVDTNACHQYHFPEERRRDPFPHFYDSTPCPAVHPSPADGYQDATACPDRDQCSHCHNLFEELYHPHLFRTRPCQFFSTTGCGWSQHGVCSDAHGDEELRVYHSREAYPPKPSVAPAAAAAPPSVAAPSSTSAPSSVSGAASPSTASAAPAPVVVSSTPAVPAHLLNSLPDDSEEVKKLRGVLRELDSEHARLEAELSEKQRVVVGRVTEFMETREKQQQEAREAEYKQLEGELAQQEAVKDTLSERIQCPICFNNDRDCVAVPCGHSFCQTCVGLNKKGKDNPTDKCMICSNKVYKVQPIFL